MAVKNPIAGAASTITNGIGDVIGTVQHNVVKDTVAAVADSVRDVARQVNAASVLVLSEVGVVKLLAQGGAVDTRGKKGFATTIVDTIALLKRKNKDVGVGGETLDYYTNEDPYERDNFDVDYNFKIGDFYLPINMTFEVSGEKLIASSQLVDGIMIYERIANSPRTITCSFDVQRRDPYDVDSEYGTVNSRMQIVQDSEVGSTEITTTDGLSQLTSIFTALYQSSTVFEVRNNMLNNEMGIQYAFVKSFNAKPQTGNTLVSVSFTLYEVNVQDEILFMNDTAGENSAMMPTNGN